jgi:hypothetical protein
MKIPYAARFSTVAFLSAALYTWLQMQPGLPLASDSGTRQIWLHDHVGEWNLGWWLWLIAIFSWMVLLVVLSWSYLPAHRVASALQSGLMLIGAILAIGGVTVWMQVLPVALTQIEASDPLTSIIDALALSLLGSGCMMGGITTIWIAYDLIQQKVLPRSWLVLAIISGVCAVLAPFLYFHIFLLLTGLAGWLVWGLWLATRRRLPSPFPTWPDT